MSEFTAGERPPFPHIQADYDQVDNFATWPTEALQDRLRVYSAFIDQDPMPRARALSEKLLMHILFELDYRDE